MALCLRSLRGSYALIMAKDGWISVSKNDPCPICGKPDNCKISLDGRAVWCGREKNQSGRQNAGGQYLHYLEDYADIRPRPSSSTSKNWSRVGANAQPKPRDWASEAEYFVNLGHGRLWQLADEFQVDVDVLRRLHIGITTRYGRDKWTFPERDPNGTIVGVNCRDVMTGEKRAMTGSSRGLTFALDWHETPGAIYLPEGASDTAVSMQMGLCAVGRMNNVGSVHLIAELLCPFAERQIIVLGENDQKENGNWPGRNGAITCAKSLANALGRTVYWALPPPGFKDVRAYHTAAGPKPEWKLELNAVEPQPFEPFVAQVGKSKTLQELRPELVQLRLVALEHPGIYFDGSPTGAGKSFADMAAMKQAGTSLILLPTHRNGDELATSLRKKGFEVDKLPVRKTAVDYEEYEKQREKNSRLPEQFAGVCDNMDEVKKAEKFGLSAGAVVCPTCPFKSECDFLEQYQFALAAPHLITTHQMFAGAWSKLVENRRYIAIHEDPKDMIRPLVTATVKDLEWLLKVGAEGSHQRRWFKRRSPDVNEVLFFDTICDKTKELLTLLREASRTQVFQELSPADKVKQHQIYQACKSLEDRDLLTDSEIGAAGMKLILGLLSGRLCHWAIRVTGSDDHRQGHADRANIGVFQTHLPEDRTIVISDATNSAEALEELIGRPVIDRTPPGRPKRKFSVVQMPTDVTRKTASSSVLKLLSGVMAHRPQAQQMGIIGFRPHINELGKFLETSALGPRVSKMCYFGEGPDRASNEWHAQCDLLVVLGTPRLPQESIVDHLIRHNRFKEALEDGRWGPRRWEAETTAGSRRVVEGLGYANLSWRRAHSELVQTQMLQSLGRARSFQDEGIPAVVFSAEPLNLPVEEQAHEITPLSKRAHQVFEWLESEVAKMLNSITKDFGNFSSTFSFSTKDAVHYARMSPQNASKALSELAAIGYLERVDHGQWAISQIVLLCKELH